MASIVLQFIVAIHFNCSRCQTRDGINDYYTIITEKGKEKNMKMKTQQ